MSVPYLKIINENTNELPQMKGKNLRRKMGR
jgi:hypothetical protein